jgi:hypothetical protein
MSEVFTDLSGVFGLAERQGCTTNNEGMSDNRKRDTTL